MKKIVQLYLEIFSIIGIGFIASLIIQHFRVQSVRKYYTNFLIYGPIPVFTVFILWQNRFHPAEYLSIFGITALLTLYGYLAARFLAAKFHEDFRNVFLPVTFMNSIYLALPVAVFFFGDEAVGHVIIFNFFVFIYHFTIGIFLIGSKVPGWRNEMKSIMKNPLIYPVLLGSLLNFAQVPFPAALSLPADLLKKWITYLLLFFIGFSVSFDKKKETGAGLLLSGIFFRMVLGGFIGFIGAEIFGLEGIIYKTCILVAAMPSAVNSYILTEKFAPDSSFALKMVLYGTVFSALTLPVLYLLLN